MLVKTSSLEVITESLDSTLNEYGSTVPESDGAAVDVLLPKVPPPFLNPTAKYSPTPKATKINAMELAITAILTFRLLSSISCRFLAADNSANRVAAVALWDSAPGVLSPP